MSMRPTNAVDENSAVGTSVGITASASDADVTTNAITYTLDDSAGGLFAIDASTGVVTVAGALECRDRDRHNITVRATSDDGSFSTQGFTINVNDLDEFDVGAISDTDGTANTVAEDAVVGTAVGVTALATDGDVTDGVTYSLSDNAGGRFTIDASTGVITVNAALDYETATSHSVTVLATSDDGSTSSQAFTITVSDVDEFDVGAISDTNGAPDAVDENAAAGTSVGVTAFATDGDGSNNTVTYSLTDTAGGLFTIDTNTGIVTTTAAIDAETATSYDITVRADSTDGSFATRTFTIAVNDLDEADVGAVSDVDVTANTVDENSAVGTTVGITASATDADVTDAITYTLDDSAGGLFAIDANTGVVTVAGALDAETSTSHNITVRATSDDGSFSTQGFTIDVNDLDEFDVGAISDTNAAADTVAEDAVVGTTVGITALATDGDVTDGVTYSLSDNAGGRFAIDASTGVITVNAALDYETATSHSVTVLATSDDGSTASQAFTINVTDVNESGVGALSDTDGAADSVSENSAVGTSVGITAFADDTDAGDTVSYSLDDDAGGLFAIDTNTGIVTVNGALDAETANSHNITVRASSTDGSFTTLTFSIAINDINEAPSVSAISDQVIDEDTSTGALAFTIGDPETPAGSLTVTAASSDPALIPNANLVLGGSGTNRTLTVTPAPDQYGGPVTITVTVSDGVNSITETFTVTVNPVNDAAIIGGVDSGAVTEDTDPDLDGLLEAAGALTITDADSGEAGFTAGTVAGTYGSISIDTAGNWTYAADNTQAAVQSLAAGATLTDTITVTSVDGSTHDVTITFTGTNDAPTARDDGPVSVNPGSAVTINLAGNDIDIDNAIDLTSIIIVSGPANGTLVVINDGTVIYTHDGGTTTSDSFTYTIMDASGAVSGTATVNLQVIPVVVTDPGPNPDPDDTPVDDTGVEEIIPEVTPVDNGPAPAPVTATATLTQNEVSAVPGSEFAPDDPDDYTVDNIILVSQDNPGLIQRTAQGMIDKLERFNHELWDVLENMKDEMSSNGTNDSRFQLLVKSATGLSLTLSIGAVSWAIRGTTIMASMLSSMPLWKGFDPLPLLSARKLSRTRDEQDDDVMSDDDLITDERIAKTAGDGRPVGGRQSTAG